MYCVCNFLNIFFKFCKYFNFLSFLVDWHWWLAESFTDWHTRFSLVRLIHTCRDIHTGSSTWPYEIDLIHTENSQLTRGVTYPQMDHIILLMVVIVIHSTIWSALWNGGWVCTFTFNVLRPANVSREPILQTPVSAIHTGLYVHALTLYWYLLRTAYG